MFELPKRIMWDGNYTVCTYVCINIHIICSIQALALHYYDYSTDENLYIVAYRDSLLYMQGSFH